MMNDKKETTDSIISAILTVLLAALILVLFYNLSAKMISGNTGEKFEAETDTTSSTIEPLPVDDYDESPDDYTIPLVSSPYVEEVTMDDPLIPVIPPELEFKTVEVIVCAK